MAAADNPAQAIQELTGLVRALLEKTGGEAVTAALADWPDPVAITRDLAPRPLPVLCWLAEAHENAARDAAPLTGCLAQAGPGLCWGQTYSAADFGEVFLERYGWCELIGGRGPVASDRIACGFLMLGPDTEYPRHWYEAEEIYLPLSGRAHWLCGEAGEWTRPKPLSVIHHKSNQPHAMRTGAAPLLALYLWRGGNLAQKSRIG